MDGSETQTFNRRCLEMVWCRKVNDKHQASAERQRAEKKLGRV